MDEPCSALDPISTARVEDLMDDLKKDYTIVIVTHNMQQARRVSDMTACLMLDEESGRGHRTGILAEFSPTDLPVHQPQGQAHRSLHHRPDRLRRLDQSDGYMMTPCKKMFGSCLIDLRSVPARGESPGCRDGRRCDAQISANAGSIAAPTCRSMTVGRRMIALIERASRAATRRSCCPITSSRSSTAWIDGYFRNVDG